MENKKTKKTVAEPDVVMSDAQQPEETTQPTKKSGKVEVDESVLQSILQEISELKAAQKEYEQTATQDQIRRIESLRAQGKLVKSIKLRRFQGKLVLGWSMIVDDVYFMDGKLIEKQIFKVIFEDGSEKEVSQIEFSRGGTYEPYEVVKEAKIDGDMEYTVMLPNGKELTVAGKFVN